MLSLPLDWISKQSMTCFCYNNVDYGPYDGVEFTPPLTILIIPIPARIAYIIDRTNPKN